MLQLSLLPRNLNSTYATARPTPTKSEHLQTQFTTKDALLASKEETLALLHISFNRP